MAWIFVVLSLLYGLPIAAFALATIAFFDARIFGNRPI